MTEKKFKYEDYANQKIYLGEGTMPIQILFGVNNPAHQAILKHLQKIAKRKKMSINNLVRISLEDRYKKIGRKLYLFLQERKEKMRVNKSMAKLVKDFIVQYIIKGE